MNVGHVMPVLDGMETDFVRRAICALRSRSKVWLSVRRLDEAGAGATGNYGQEDGKTEVELPSGIPDRKITVLGNGRTMKAEQ